MDVTTANIRREYATERSLWAQVMGYGLLIGLILESARRLLVAGSDWRLTLGAALILAGVGAWLVHAAARRVRAAAFGAELWRKFGLDRELLDAVAQLDPPDPAIAAALDLLLRDLRSLAAVRNHAAWDEPDAPQPGAVVEAAEETLRTELREHGATARLTALRTILDDLAQSQRMTLAALLADRPEEQAEAWEAFGAAEDRLLARGQVADDASAGEPITAPR